MPDRAKPDTEKQTSGDLPAELEDRLKVAKLA